MIKRVILLLAFFSILKVGVAQSIPTFSKYFDEGHVYDQGVSIIADKDSIFIESSNFDGRTFQGMVFIKTNNNGNEVYRQKLYKPNFYYADDLARTTYLTHDGYFIAGGGGGTSTDIQQHNVPAYLYKTSNNFDSIQVITYHSALATAFLNAVQLSDSNYLLSGYRDSNGVGSALTWVVKTDTRGNIIWQKNIPESNHSFARYTDPFDGGFFVQTEVNATNNSGYGYINLHKFDNGGNEKWVKSFGIPDANNNGGPIVALPDGGGVIMMNNVDTTARQITNHNGIRTFYRFDSLGNILWQSYFRKYPDYVTSIKLARNGDLLFTGIGYGLDSVSGQYVMSGYISRIDTSGHQLWADYIYTGLHFYTSFSQLFDITECSDGGIAAIGLAINPIDTNQDTWLVKVDSNGCLMGDCPRRLYTGISDLSDVADRFLVFPNPASSVFSVVLRETGYMRDFKDLHFTLYDLTGRIVMNESLKEQTTTLHRNDIPDGMYLWQISEGETHIANGKMVFR